MMKRRRISIWLILCVVLAAIIIRNINMNSTATKLRRIYGDDLVVKDGQFFLASMNNSPLAGYKEDELANNRGVEISILSIFEKANHSLDKDMLYVQYRIHNNTNHKIGLTPSYRIETQING